MAIVRLDQEVDLDELENAEYEEGDFESYSGELPKTGTVIDGYIKKAWLTYTGGEDDPDAVPMIKVLIVSDSDDDYYGLPVWDQIVLKTEAAFRYKPFCNASGLTLRQLLTKMNLADDDDKIGAPILNIEKWKPGADARIRFITKLSRWNGEWRTTVSQYLEAESSNGTSKPAGRRAKADPPARRGRAARQEPEDEPEDEEAEEETPARPTRRAAASSTRGGARTARKAKAEDEPSAPARRGRRTAAKPADDDSEPPF